MNKFLDFINKSLKEENVSQDIQTVDTVVGKITKEKKPKTISFIDDEDELDTKELLKKLKEDSDLVSIEDESDIDELDYNIYELFVVYQSLYLLPIAELEEHVKTLEEILSDFGYEMESDAQDEYYRESLLEDLVYFSLLLIEEGLDSEDILYELDIEEQELFLSDDEANNILDELYDMFGLDIEELQQSEISKATQAEQETPQLAELEEAAGRFTSKSFNRKRRKFMKNSISTMNKTKAKRQQANRQNKAKRKQYYRQNKTKIKRYNQQYRKAVKSGSHKVKIRRRQG